MFIIRKNFTIFIIYLICSRTQNNRIFRYSGRCPASLITMGILIHIARYQALLAARHNFHFMLYIIYPFWPAFSKAELVFQNCRFLQQLSHKN